MSYMVEDDIISATIVADINDPMSSNGQMGYYRK